VQGDASSWCKAAENDMFLMMLQQVLLRLPCNYIRGRRACGALQPGVGLETGAMLQVVAGIMKQSPPLCQLAKHDKALMLQVPQVHRAGFRIRK